MQIYKTFTKLSCRFSKRVEQRLVDHHKAYSSTPELPVLVEEIRILQVVEEIRILRVAEELRILEIAGEIRILEIAGEARILRIVEGQSLVPGGPQQQSE